MAGLTGTGESFSYGHVADWSTSNALVHPQVALKSDPLNSASRPFAGIRTSLTIRSASSEMPAHMKQFAARDFSEFEHIEEVRKRSVELNNADADKEREREQHFDEEIMSRTTSLRQTQTAHLFK